MRHNLKKSEKEMSTKAPLKRHKALQSLSREHHHSLLLSWKIRRGFHNKVDVKRIKSYTDWFYKSHIEPHFNLEEEMIFPILSSDHELIKKAISEHRRLQRLFSDTDDIEKSLSLLEEELEKHIRFEERVLFPEIQLSASAEQLKNIEVHHGESTFKENVADEFWK